MRQCRNTFQDCHESIPIRLTSCLIPALFRLEIRQRSAGPADKVAIATDQPSQQGQSSSSGDWSWNSSWNDWAWDESGWSDGASYSWDDWAYDWGPDSEVPGSGAWVTPAELDVPTAEDLREALEAQDMIVSLTEGMNALNPDQCPET